jgi:hypothetical protein
MKRIAFDLDWTPLERGDQRPAAVTRQRKGGCIALSDARNEALGQFHIRKLLEGHIRDGLFVRLLAARRERSSGAGEEA